MLKWSFNELQENISMTHNQVVPGSSPGGPTIKTSLYNRWGFFIKNVQGREACLNVNKRSLDVESML